MDHQRPVSSHAAFARALAFGAECRMQGERQQVEIEGRDTGVPGGRRGLFAFVPGDRRGLGRAREKPYQQGPDKRRRENGLSLM
jgi:hypothetical protein